MSRSPSHIADANSATSLAKTLAPEDVCVGDYVAPLYEAYDYPSFCWCSDAVIVDRQQTVRIEFMAREGGVPLKVIAVCLPFVLVKRPQGKPRTLDVRQVKLARLDNKYASKAWKAFTKCDKKKA